MTSATKQLFLTGLAILLSFFLSAQPSLKRLRTLLQTSGTASFEASWMEVDSTLRALPVKQALLYNDTLLHIAADLPQYQPAFSKMYESMVQLYYRTNNEKYQLLYLLGIYKDPVFNKPDIQRQMLYSIGSNYHSIGDFSNAELYLKEYLASKAPAQINEKINAITTLGLIYRQKEEYTISARYMQTALDTAIAANATDWIGLASGNLGESLMLLGKQNEAIPYLQKDIAISIARNNYESAGGSYALLGKIYLLNGNSKAAKYTLDSARLLLDKVEGRTRFSNARADTYRNLAEYFSQNGRGDSAYEYLKKSAAIIDTISFRRAQAQLKLQILSFHSEEEQRDAAVLKAMVAQAIRDKLFLSILILSKIVLAVFVVMYVRQKRKITRMLKEEALVAAQQKEEQSLLNQTKNKLFSLVAHDLRGPIGSISSMLDLMEAKAVSPDELAILLPDIKNRINNIREVTNNLLQWAYSQFGGFKYAPELVDVSIVSQKTIDLLHFEADRKEVTIQNNIRRSSMVWADPNHVETILRNLVSNALKFSPAGGSIQIRFQQKDDRMATISVADTGSGISEQLISKLRNGDILQSSIGTAGEKGVGLGLMMCRDFIATNGGMLWAERNTPTGSIFSFTLLLAKP